MDEPLQEFEAELKALIPCSVSPGLVNRIAHELAEPIGEDSMVLEFNATSASRFKAWCWLGLGAAGIAATIAFVFTFVRSAQREGSVGFATPEIVAEKKGPPQIDPAEGRISADSYQPVAASNVLYEMKDEGPASSQGDSLERRVRYRYVDTYTWKNPRNNASLTWSVPRDEIRVQPAQFN